MESIIRPDGSVCYEYTGTDPIRVSFERLIPTNDKRDDNVKHYYEPLLKISSERVKPVNRVSKK